MIWAQIDLHITDRCTTHNVVRGRGRPKWERLKKKGGKKKRRKKTPTWS